jgi:hypothetical protein
LAAAFMIKILLDISKKNLKSVSLVSHLENLFSEKVGLTLYEDESKLKWNEKYKLEEIVTRETKKDKKDEKEKWQQFRK